MTTRGRKPQPAAVKRAKGNPGRRRIVDAPEDASNLKAAAPKELSAAARKIWEHLAPELGRLKFLRETDRAAFMRYCEHAAKWWKLTRDLRKEGETYETSSAHGSMLRVNPKFLVRERVEKRLEALEDRFGLSPSARQQILQRLAAVPPAAPAGDLFEDKDGAAVAAPGSPLGMLNNGGAVH